MPEDGAHLESMESCLAVVAEKLVCGVDRLGLSVGFSSNAACCYTKRRTESSV